LSVDVEEAPALAMNAFRSKVILHEDFGGSSMIIIQYSCLLEKKVVKFNRLINTLKESV